MADIIKEKEVKEVREVREVDSTSPALIVLIVAVILLGFFFWFFLANRAPANPPAEQPGINVDVNLPNGNNSTSTY